jgi:hypothetical protein
MYAVLALVTGVFSLVFIIVILACYVVSALGFYKALKRLGYNNAWMAWIPFANYYALADAAANGQEEVNLIGTLTIPAILYKLWWLVMLVAAFIPVIGNILVLVIRVICLGSVFIKLLARLTYTSEQSQQAMGYVSGLIPIVAAIKFLTLK